MDRPAAVLFDLDDTLYNRAVCFPRWAEWFIRERLGIVDERERLRLVETFVELDGRGWVTEVFQWLRVRYPAIQSTEEAFIETFFQDYSRHLTLDLGAEILITTLEQCRIPFGIVTNGSPHQLGKLARLGIDRRATCVLVSDIVGHKKPDPVIFLAAASDLNVRPDETLVVGDDPDNDIVGAKHIGMRTAWVHRGRDWPSRLSADRPAYMISSLAELVPLVMETSGS